MKNLIIDIGNTQIKSGLFSGNDLLWEASHPSLEVALKEWADLTFAHCFISSVRWTEEDLSRQLPFPFTLFSSDTPLPIQNRYETPHTLGLDRLAAAVGAWSKSGGRPSLAIDLGSCITYEVVDESGNYLGGSISPGMYMRSRAMHEFTARLPLVAVTERPQSPVGRKTQTSLESGIWFGIKYEIIGHINAYQEEYPDLQVFICGGDAQSFVSLAKAPIFVVPNLVLHGLNFILNHHAKKH